MKPITWIVGVGVAAALLGAMLTARAENWKPGASAPAFSAAGSDGKDHSLKSLTGDKPLVLYFIGESCPVNNQAVKYYNRVAEAYKGKVNFVGVIDGDKAKHAQWQAKHKAPYTVLFDPDMKVIRSYKAERSPWTILVGKDGKIVKEWVGYSIGEIDELSAEMAKQAKVALAKIDTSGAPASPRAG